MEFLANFVDGVAGFFEAIWGFFSGVIGQMQMLGEYIALASTTAYSLVDTLPPWLQAFATATILIAIIYLILGRDAGGSSD